jgi:hypothetical protein
MSGPDALPGEMPGFPFPGRPGGEHDEPLLDMIIARRALPPDAPQEMHDLACMLAALAGPGEPGELTGEAAARAAFARSASPVGLAPAAQRPMRRHRQSRRPRRPLLSRAGLTVALACAAAGVSVLAAYANLLPGPVQRLAHVAVAAPPPPPLRAAPPPAVGSLLSRSAGRTAPARSPGPAAGMPHGPGGSPAHGQPHTSRPPAARTPAPVRSTTSASCAPGQKHPAQPGAEPSVVPGSPAWWLTPGCGGVPGAQPKRVATKLSSAPGPP